MLAASLVLGILLLKKMRGTPRFFACPPFASVSAVGWSVHSCCAAAAALHRSTASRSQAISSGRNCFE